jgi:hypothetical protein
MPALVLGDRSAPFLEKLSSRLKEETRKVAEELDNRSYDFYTPWMSMRPLLNKPIKEKLLHTQRLEPGDLVISQQSSVSLTLRGCPSWLACP